MTFFKRIESKLRRGDVATWLLTINIAMFLLYWSLRLLCPSLCIENILSLPSNFAEAMMKPWTIITYMFTHFSLLHLLCNMLYLYWFSRLFEAYISDKQLLLYYIVGGVVSGVVYLIANASGLIISQQLVGASAAVMCIMTATAITHPNVKINLLLIGEVRLLWVALICIALSFFGSGNGGGVLAHVAGAVTGAVFALNQKFSFLRHRSHRNAAGRKMHAPRIQTPPDVRLDALLDKIRISGYASLSKAEKRELQQLSLKIKGNTK